MKGSSPDNYGPAETPIAVDEKLLSREELEQLSREELELLQQQSIAAIAALDVKIADLEIQRQKIVEQEAALDGKEAELAIRERKLAQEIKSTLHTSQAAWELGNNPLFIWSAIAVLGDAEELPQWIRAYLSKVGNSLLALAADQNVSPKDATNAIARELGLSRKGWNAFENIRLFENSAEPGFKLAIAATTGEKSENVANELAKHYGLTARTLYAYRKSFVEQIMRVSAIERELPEKASGLK
jgi:hypothetical protein